MRTLLFFVPGLPAPGGSKKFVGFGKKTGRAVLIDMGGEKTKNWRSTCAQVGMQQMAGTPLLEGPLSVTFEFFVPRPKSHFGKKGLKATAPKHPLTKPDALKLARSTEDAFTGVVWSDDAQTVRLTIGKNFETNGCGCNVLIEQLS